MTGEAVSHSSAQSLDMEFNKATFDDKFVPSFDTLPGLPLPTGSGMQVLSDPFTLRPSLPPRLFDSDMDIELSEDFAETLDEIETWYDSVEIQDEYDSRAKPKDSGYGSVDYTSIPDVTLLEIFKSRFAMANTSAALAAIGSVLTGNNTTSPGLDSNNMLYTLNNHGVKECICFVSKK